MLPLSCFIRLLSTQSAKRNQYKWQYLTKSRSHDFFSTNNPVSSATEITSACREAYFLFKKISKKILQQSASYNTMLAPFITSSNITLFPYVISTFSLYNQKTFLWLPHIAVSSPEFPFHLSYRSYNSGSDLYILSWPENSDVAW